MNRQIYESISDTGTKLLMARFVPEKNLSGFTEPGGVTKVRTVTDYETVLFMKDGGKCAINNSIYSISAGDIRFHKPGDVVYSHRYSDIYVAHFQCGDTGRRVKELEEIPCFMPSFYRSTVKEIMESLIKSKLAANAVETNYSLWKLIKTLSDNAKLMNRNGVSSKTTNVIDAAEHFICENYHENIKLSDIAASVYLHPNYFHRLFYKNKGISPTTYLLEVRLNKAAEELITSGKKLDDIAESCGFCNSSYFIKNFKGVFGLTPSEYRKKNTSYRD